MNLTARIATTVVGLACLLALSASAALASTGHSPATSFGGPGAGAGQFSGGPSGVGVGTAGTVYASDPGNSRIESFAATGAFKAEFAINAAEFTNPAAVAVDSTVAGGVYVAVTNATTFAGEVAKYSAAGTFDYTLNPAGSETTINYGPVAVDPSTGTVYTLATNSETFQQVVDSFSQSTGAFIASFNGETASPDGSFMCPSALSADNSHVFILDACKGRVDQYSSAGLWEATIDNGSRGTPEALASNPTTGDLYVAEAAASGLQVTYFPAAGSGAPQTFAATAVSGLGGLAVGPDATVYAADYGKFLVDRFAAFEGPTVTSEAPSPIEATSATLNGTIDPNGVAAKYHYEYGPELSYGSSTPEVAAGSGSATVPAPAAITDLAPNATYHYRIVGVNASGSIVGEDQTFTTAAAPPLVDGSPAYATPIAPTEARVHATVNPNNNPTTFRIEYGTTTTYSSSAPIPDGEVGSGFAEIPVASMLTGLQPATLYHYRVSAENGIGGAQLGADGTFITAPAAPAAGIELTTKQGILTGTIDPHGIATTYHFNYGPSTEYGASTPETEAGSGNGEEEVTAPVSGLSPSTTYHVEVVAITNGVTRTGADGTFTTPPAPAATVSDPTAVTSGSATLQGTANTFGLGGTYHFEVVALDGTYTANTSQQALPAATGSRPVSVTDASLPPGETLRILLVVTSNESTGHSESVTFTTASLPPEGFPALPSPSSVYGCNAPKLDPANGKVKPGSSVAISGSDLGLSGSVLLGENALNPTNWSASGFTIEVPGDAVGTLGLTVNCGVVSNAVALATTEPPAGPANAFTLTKRSVAGSAVTFTVVLPGPGTLQTSSARTKGTSSKVTKAGTQTIKVTLSKAGAKALEKAKKRSLTVKVQLRFTPTGGSGASQTTTVTFMRKAGH